VLKPYTGKKVSMQIKNLLLLLSTALCMGCYANGQNDYHKVTQVEQVLLPQTAAQPSTQYQIPKVASIKHERIISEPLPPDFE